MASLRSTEVDSKLKLYPATCFRFSKAGRPDPAVVALRMLLLLYCNCDVFYFAVLVKRFFKSGRSYRVICGRLAEVHGHKRRCVVLMYIRERGSVLYLGMAQEFWDFAKFAIA